MAQKNFRAMAQTLIFWGFEPWLKPTFDMQILTSPGYASDCQSVDVALCGWCVSEMVVRGGAGRNTVWSH